MGYLKAFGVFLIWACIALVSHHYISNLYFNNCFSTAEDGKTQPQIIDKVAASYLLNEKLDTILTFDNGIKIVQGSPEIEGEMSIANALNDVLQNDYTKKLSIKGKYTSAEQYLDSVNLGMQRAGKLYDHLLASGTGEHQLTKSSVIDNDLFETDSVHSNGIDLRISTLTVQEIKVYESTLETKRLYIDFNDEMLAPTPELRSLVGPLKAYLKRYPDKKVYITGHTANAGYYQENVIIGQDRADQIRQFFIGEQIEASKLVALSRGESEPIAPKGTPEGIRLNKRIEIQIK